MLKKIFLLLLLVGLVLGPGYWVYGKFFTGTEAARIDLTRADAAPDAAWRSAPFSLTPDMAPLGLVLNANGQLAPNLDKSRPPKDRYAAVLFKDGQAAKPLGFTLGVKNTGERHPAFKEHLVYFQVVQPGRYHVEVTPAAAPEIQLQSMQLEVRQHLHEPDSKLVTIGMVVMILGIMGLFI